ncbi:hypothetical protein [Streptomyces sp. NPDC001601]|uniref:hypothetical protein n=1 Tax=unclassified Streptomyces TaxID=2593676 RepID=UPI00367CD699
MAPLIAFALALRSLRPQEVGSAAGALNVVQQLGATLGVAVLGSACLDGSAVTACAVAVALTALCWATSRRM